MKIRLVDLNTFIIKPDEKAIEKVSDGYEFYLFKSDALLTRSDQLFEAKNGDCILFSANENINIKPTDSELEVLHLSFKSADFSKFLSSLDYQTNSLQTPIQTYFIDNITDKIAKENTLKDLHYESIISILVEELFTKISRFVPMKHLKASSTLQTIGSPLILKEVLTITGKPVNDAKFSISS